MNLLKLTVSDLSFETVPANSFFRKDGYETVDKAVIGNMNLFITHDGNKYEAIANFDGDWRYYICGNDDVVSSFINIDNAKKCGLEYIKNNFVSEITYNT